MPVKTANKHELRTRETRSLLLAAAETVFARDGYEGAELGEIAALAGRTKGSIYAQFKSKEDIFLALIEDRTRRYRAQMDDFLAQSKTIEDNKAALKTFYLHRTEDHPWSLLLLEFKLFALRHPESKKRLQDLRSAVIVKNSESRFTEILGAAGTGADAISRVMAVESMQPIVSALVLEAQLDSSLSATGAVAKVTGRILDALFEDVSPEATHSS